MSYSGGGPHIWVPRRLAGLGATGAGRYLIPQSIGTAEAGGYANTLSAGAQGYISQQAASAARDTFRQQTGIDAPWVPIVDPTTPSGQSVIGQYAQEQVNVWTTAQIQNGIRTGAAALEEKLSGTRADGTFNKVYAEIQNPLGEDETAMWLSNYLLANPQLLTNPTPEGAARMAQAFIFAQCDAIGLPPEFMVVGDLIHNFPTSVESAATWGITLGTGFLAQFGCPIITSTDSSAFLSCCARAGIAQTFPGVPFALCEATYGALSDGSLTFSEAQGLVINACAAIGSAIGQMFGIPAPLGALLSQLLAKAIVPLLADALGFGPSDSEKLNAAQQAAAAAAGAATVVCTDLARALWLQYQHYWDSMEGNLGDLIHANQEWLLGPNGCSTNDGIRLFREQLPGGNTLDVVRNPDGTEVLVNKHPLKYQRPMEYYCREKFGCPYLSYGARFRILRRDSYDLSAAAINKGRVPVIDSQPPGCDALSALAFWGARRYVTPYQVLYAMTGQPPDMYMKPLTWVQGQTGPTKPPWDQTLHSDDEYLRTIGLVRVEGSAGETVGQCRTRDWAKYMIGSLQQAAAASALVQRDVTRTVSSATTQYGLQKHMEDLAGVPSGQWQYASDATKKAAVRAAAARAATFRSALLEAKRRGARRGDVLNYSLLAAGGAALAGWAVARRR